jgi:integrase/recombinase XerD
VSDLNQHLQDYLRLRRALGFKLAYPGQVLPQFLTYLAQAGATSVTTVHALAWARLPQDVQPIHYAHRLGAVRGFASYLQTIDPDTEVPPKDVFGARQQRPVPYLWEPTQVHALLKAAHLLQPSWRAATYETIYGLLAVTGLRIGEVLALTCGDVDLDAGILTVTGQKSRPRLIPVTPSTVAALSAYRHQRRWWAPHPTCTAFFLTATGTPVTPDPLRATFNQLTTTLGLRTDTVKPRIHDLRHSFAVHTLIGWQRSGADIASLLPRLSTYLGHVNPAGTYWYLQAVPELMGLAATQLQARFPATNGAGK